ncbi:uncharacterized protein LOC120351705 [Nilaparvata lugens]|uniref:uncharacterized protein LOC120351705 n=1 Tax=Nilaparvata lugens TaxID=108931 RepID=UPI00193DA6AC|nr:uncharacterized protein LOC120351705 [Nilaparvata lugens]
MHAICQLQDICVTRLRDCDACFATIFSRAATEQHVSLPYSRVVCCQSTLNASSMKFHLDPKLTWKPHVKYVSTELCRVIYLLRSLANTSNYWKSMFRYHTAEQGLEVHVSLPYSKQRLEVHVSLPYSRAGIGSPCFATIQQAAIGSPCFAAIQQNSN